MLQGLRSDQKSKRKSRKDRHDRKGVRNQIDVAVSLGCDAWNRLVKVVSGSNTVSYSYDALGRRVTETTNSATQNLYFDGTNVIEERAAGSTSANLQYVWCPLMTNTLVERDRDTTGNGVLNERLWYEQDANNDVMGVLNSSGAVVEN